MHFRWRLTSTTALLVAALACGGQPEPAPGTNTPPATDVVAHGGGVDIVGKLAPSVASPAALVVLAPQSGVEVPVKAEPAVLDQAGYEFLPGFLLAQTGQAVQFRNSENVLHNVRVTEASQQTPIFNVATAPYGNYEFKFAEPGLYNVGCDIHPTMKASILVTATPYTATTGADGSFIMTNVKPGQYNLTVYAEGAPVVRSVEVKTGKTDLGTIQ